MVTTTALHGAEQAQLTAGLSPEDGARVLDALAYVRPIYANHAVRSGQPVMEFVQELTAIMSILNCDAPTRIAGLLAEVAGIDPMAAEDIEARFGREVSVLVNSIRQLRSLRERASSGQQEVLRGKNAAQQAVAQVETLRKMLLSMASDMRVVMIRLASRVATLRYFAEKKLQDDMVHRYAKETLDVYAPLANRLGIWQLKWELEDFSFRFLQPDEYRHIARMLEEKRIEREDFIARAIIRLKAELASAGIKADVSGRPKHIFSIWNKLRGKSLDFSELYDVRAFRIIVDDVKTCYAVLGIVHELWNPILKEFDDYISRPKPNGYQSLHTIVVTEDGLPIEVQIRTADMHHFAEYGVAAHWRYKEVGSSGAVEQQYNERIAWLRQLLAWQTDVADAVAAPEETKQERAEQLKSAGLDERIYVLTPQARVIELPSGATPIDFAYHLHSDVGHRCRGAKVEGVMVPLNTPLKNGQTVEIITAKGSNVNAGPSRDWLSPGYVASSRTKSKIRAWFNAIDLQETLNSGRTTVEKTLQREGKTAVNLEELAHRLGFPKVDDFFLAVGKEAVSPRMIEMALHADQAAKEETEEDIVVTRKSKSSSVVQGAKSGVLVVGTDGLMTQLAKCCKPAPPDDIVGFVTRGKGVSIHRADCSNFAEMQHRTPERVIQTAWGKPAHDTVYPVDIFVLASDRQGLLRDISEVFSREKINVIGVNTQSSKGIARMSFTAEINSTEQLQKAIGVIREVKGVQDAKRH